MFQKPKAAKKLYFDVIPRTVDEYLQFLAAYPRQDAEGQARQRRCGTSTPATPPAAELPITFALLLNLVAASNAARQGRAVGLHPPPRAGRQPETHPLLDHLAGYAVRYYEDFVKPQKKFRPRRRGRDRRRCARCRMRSARPRRARAPRSCRRIIYDVGRSIPRYQDLNAKGATPDEPGVSNAWFNAIYEVLLGEEKGPRFGSFIELYGVDGDARADRQGAEGRADQGRLERSRA